MHSSNHIIISADDTTMVGLISKNNESAYREEVQQLTAWCKVINPSLNVDKTKEMVVDFRRAQSHQSPLNIDRSSVEIVKCIKFLGTLGNGDEDDHGPWERDGLGGTDGISRVARGRGCHPDPPKTSL
ncbi:hypothetical protein QTP70_000622 [Hemibagrus guttatus]|uniref:Reverse transcriptase domain-containing protein n=1 Tax=Hemibagrus guttatus TaxID=175788 RepID=A0AAE0PRP7_9TELE|nr:hypothetical protein QTP70_000622 [Hemibagrus guttatus]